MWIDQNQNAFIKLPDHFTTNALLPFLSNDDDKLPQYFNLAETPNDNINLISYDPMSIQKTSALTSRIRTYTTITNMTSFFFLDSSFFCFSSYTQY